MKKYFKFVGIAELICASISIYVNIILIFNSFIVRRENLIVVLALLGILLLQIILAPAIGLLFLSYSKSLPDPPKPQKVLTDIDTIYYVTGGKRCNYEKHEKVVCTDKNLIKKYNISEEGEIVQILNSDIYVRFAAAKGHYTLCLSYNQIKKLK